MKVTLLHHSPLWLIEHGARVCTNTEDKLESCEVTPGMQDFIQKLVERGHHSVLEHVTYTFYIEGVSRALLQELARHRVGMSLSVQSTRWALKKILDQDTDIYLPDKLTKDDNREAELCIGQCLAMADYLQKQYGNDVAKYVLPECITTTLQLTCNARSLNHLFALRSNPPALREFNELCMAMDDALPEEHKFMYM